MRVDGPLAIDTLADIVSKNGNLLLNVGLKADGTLPEDQKQALEQIGDWLDVNGEAIYGTRPWRIYGEGPTQPESGHMNERTVHSEPYTARDIRFTTKGDTLYAIALAWPDDGSLAIQSLGENNEQYEMQIHSVELIGHDAPLQWSRSNEGLTVQLPEKKPCEHAFVLRIRPRE